MNAKILALFALVAVAYVTAECPAENGEQVVYLPNHEDCRTFFMCDHGQAILRRCAEGTAWNVEEQVCDWPENAGCFPAESAEGQVNEGSVEGAAVPPVSAANFPRTA